jgi:hypothetical protein
MKCFFILIALLQVGIACRQATAYSPTIEMLHSPDDKAVQVDGPYVLYRNDTLVVHYIDSLPDSSSQLRTSYTGMAGKPQLTLSVNTDEPGKTFQVKLKQKHTTQKSEYGKPKRMLVLSDIEGQFGAFRKLLQGNGVINSDYHWTFGKGHLVLIGDFVDRGNMVTEVLWLIYALEAEAEAAGGKVHYILGNHEIMNMNGELDYVHRRYMEHAEKMQVPYIELFGPKAELGRWLNSKNVAERVGNFLFTHGGMSAYINLMGLPLPDMNDSVRKYATDTAYQYPSPQTQILFSDFGPFWYRGYYLGNPRATAAQVDSTLRIYNTSYITTGHTVVAKEIVTLYDGKVINTDLQHALGITEGLLIEGNNMVRVNIAGEKKPLQALKP